MYQKPIHFFYGFGSLADAHCTVQVPVLSTVRVRILKYRYSYVGDFITPDTPDILPKSRGNISHINIR